MIRKEKKKLSSVMAGAIGLMALFLLIPCFGPISGQTAYAAEGLTVYGFLRNNTGKFFNAQPYQENNDRLSTERTWLRTYVDWQPSDQFKVWMNVQFAYEPEYKVEEGSVSKPDGKEYSEYKDINDVLREAYIEWSPIKTLDIKLGRQIVIWGESLTDQVGDVVQPIDQRFALAFTNWEDTRIPQWMIRSIHDISSLSSSFEWIVNPLLTSEKYRVNRNAEYAMQVFPHGGAPYWEPGQRFGMYPEDRTITLPTNVLHGEVPTGFAEVYPDTWDDMRYGFRTSTIAGGYTFGVSYWHTNNYTPLVKRGAVVGHIPVNPFFSLNVRNYSLVHPKMDIYGAYMNKQLPWPGIIRAEAIYSPNKPFNTFDATDADAMVTRAYYKYAIAYDLTGYLYFPWHNTAPFDITVEHVGEVIPDNKNLAYIIYGTEQKSFVARYNTRISTNWLYDRIETELIVSYWPWARSGLLMPAVTWKPGWMNRKFSAQLKYINVYGNSHYEGLGFLGTKDMIVLTSQFNF